jgi:ATP-dependent RNA helicase DeaD
MIDQPAAAGADAAGFVALGLGPRILAALIALGYEEPTPIQREAIPPLLAGNDLLGQAATGTGKTAAFALPLLEQIVPGSPAPSALVLVPTRELAMQVAEAVYRYGRELGVRVLPIYGGQSFGQQLRVLRRGVDVVVATPGRALDHIGRGTLPLDELKMVVLDEADEMLDMGFAEDIEAILEATPAERQTVLFSATLPPRITGIARRHLRDPVQVKIAAERVAAGKAPRIRQVAYIVPRAHKPAALSRVLDLEMPSATIVFCRTRHDVDALTEALNARGYRAEALHGGMSQDQRDRVMKKFRSGNVELLVATDVAARGLDIEQLTHVVNYDVPSSPEAYVHRIGRVGRAGREGVAITLAEPREHRLLKSIEQLTKQKIEVATVPTVADMRARRLELTRAALREMIIAGDLDRFRPVVEALADEFDIMEVTLAAVKLAHEAAGLESAEEEEIPQVVPGGRGRPAAAVRKGGKAERAGEAARKTATGSAPKGMGKPTKRSAKEQSTTAAGGGPAWKPGGKGAKRAAARRGGDEGGVRLFIGSGRTSGLRPQDLVGAITGEAGISGREIGTIEIADQYSLVDVAPGVADDVIAALRGSKIKGRKVTVRRERARG